MKPWEKQLWEDHCGTWTSHYTVRNASGEVVDEYDAVNDIALDWKSNSYAQRNVYTRTKVDPSTGLAKRVSETRAYTAYWDGSVMQIKGKVRSLRNALVIVLTRAIRF